MGNAETHSPRATLRDRDALDDLALMLRAPEWRSAADYVQECAAIVAATGRGLDHPDDCHGCGISGLFGSGCSDA